MRTLDVRILSAMIGFDPTFHLAQLIGRAVEGGVALGRAHVPQLCLPQIAPDFLFLRIGLGPGE